MKITETINSVLTNISNNISHIRAEYKSRVAENHKELIRGSVLDPNNHPFLDTKAN
jgi:hypothetical protein